MPQEPLPPLGWKGSGMGSRLTDLNRWPSLYNCHCNYQHAGFTFIRVLTSLNNKWLIGLGNHWFRLSRCLSQELLPQ